MQRQMFKCQWLLHGAAQEEARLIKGLSSRVRAVPVLFENCGSAHKELALIHTAAAGLRLPPGAPVITASNWNGFHLHPWQGEAHIAGAALAMQWVAQAHACLCHPVPLQQDLPCNQTASSQQPGADLASQGPCGTVAQHHSWWWL